MAKRGRNTSKRAKDDDESSYQPSSDEEVSHSDDDASIYPSSASEAEQTTKRAKANEIEDGSEGEVEFEPGHGKEKGNDEDDEECSYSKLNRRPRLRRIRRHVIEDEEEEEEEGVTEHEKESVVVPSAIIYRYDDEFYLPYLLKDEIFVDTIVLDKLVLGKWLEVSLQQHHGPLSLVSSHWPQLIAAKALFTSKSAWKKRIQKHGHQYLLDPSDFTLRMLIQKYLSKKQGTSLNRFWTDYSAKNLYNNMVITINRFHSQLHDVTSVASSLQESDYQSDHVLEEDEELEPAQEGRASNEQVIRATIGQAIEHDAARMDEERTEELLTRAKQRAGGSDEEIQFDVEEDEIDRAERLLKEAKRRKRRKSKSRLSHKRPSSSASDVKRKLLQAHVLMQKQLPVPLEECPICMEEIQKDDLFLTNCRHNFHIKCIKQNWHNGVQNEICPMCRTPFSKIIVEQARHSVEDSATSEVGINVAVGDEVETFWDLVDEKSGKEIGGQWYTAKVLRQAGSNKISKFAVDNEYYFGYSFIIAYENEADEEDERTVIISQSMWLYDEKHEMPMYWRLKKKAPVVKPVVTLPIVRPREKKKLRRVISDSSSDEE